MRLGILPEDHTTSPLTPIMSIAVTRLMWRPQSTSTVPMLSLNSTWRPVKLSASGLV
jgi:hypothetical protein